MHYVYAISLLFTLYGLFASSYATYVVTDNGGENLCLLLDVVSKITVTYNSTGYKEKEADIPVIDDDDDVAGECMHEAEAMHGQPWVRITLVLPDKSSLQVTFVKDKKANNVTYTVLDKLVYSFDTRNPSFYDEPVLKENFTYTLENMNIPLSPLGMFYSCDNNHLIQLGPNAIMKISSVKVQVFDFDRMNYSINGNDCADVPTSSAPPVTASTATTSTEPPSTPTTSTEPPSTPTTSTETPSTPSTSTEPPSTPTTSTEPPSTPTTSTEPPSTPTTSTETPSTSTEPPSTPTTSTETPSTSTEPPSTPTASTETPSTVTPKPDPSTQTTNSPNATVTATPHPGPVTTLSPLPDATYSIEDTSGNVCLLMNYSGDFHIPYNKTDKKTDTIVVKFNSENVQKNGFCLNETQQITLTWRPKTMPSTIAKSWEISFTFQKYKAVSNVKDSKASYGLSRVGMVYVLENSTFPNTASGESVTINSKIEENTFKTPVDSAYQCKANKTIKLASGNVEMVTHDFEVQAFRNSKTKAFDGGEISCPEDKESSSSRVVPIVVGVLLSLLIVAVLVAYFIGRRRSQNQNPYEQF